MIFTKFKISNKNKGEVRKKKKEKSAAPVKLSGKDCRILTKEEKEELRTNVKKVEDELAKKKQLLKEAKKEDKKNIKENIKDEKVNLKNVKDIEKEMLNQEKKRKEFERVECNKFTNRWVQIMAYMGLSNEMSQTYALRNIEWHEYGFKANIHAPLGMNLLEIQTETAVGTIQKNLQCVFIFNDVPKSNHIEARFIIEDVGFIDFKPMRLKPYELLLSQGIDNKPMISNMLKYPHALVQGSTNMGKSKFIDIILTNLITTTNPEDVNLYIIQADKSDQYPYAGCKHCKGYTDSIMDSLLMLSHLVKIVEKRNDELKQYNYNGVCNNIAEYNEAVDKKIIKGKKKWSFMYLIVDEYATLMPESSFGADKKIKQAIQAIMERILQIGRSVGLYAILSTQRATIDKMPSFVKANCCTIVSFRVNNRKSSEIALDSGEAVNLKQREFITKSESMQFGQTYNLTQKQIIDFINPFRFSSIPKFEFASEMSEEIKEMIEGDSNKKGKRKTKSERKKEKKEIEKIAIENETKRRQELEELNKNIETKKEENSESKDIIDVKIKEKKEKVKIA